ncbi:dihydrolipoamide acetyltransferase family protein [Neobacillus vireti]|uniref:Branched-chain alpha-keto acid dehydrogenase subunit E2 n=1 Tax=Neobacillus vireti LMG 21834 TaxID=1131730 RepID=A0AB94IPK2_9BACI|nr:dihydrolipoamide acetyltransferase family protein [Neobacillus vireti]ETI69015.1 branched-chain alpha-keto acid dehydrogenase subunit E2 [Neobacillus vireti LMG 21834]
MTSLLAKPTFASPRARAYANKLGIALDHFEGSGPNGRIIEQDVIHYTEKINSQIKDLTPTKKQHRKITPLAKNISNIQNISIEQVQGSGMDGKIVSADILIKVQQSNNITDKKKLRLAGIRKVIAKRMTDSKRNAPHVTLTVKTEATHLVNYRNVYMEKHKIKISFTDLFVKIVAESLRKHPIINVSLEEEMLTYHNDINIGIAVAREEGLIVPVIHNADQKSLEQISFDVKDKVNRARTRKLKRTDTENSRFTISNLGMYEVDAFTPVINQPESAILGIGRIIEDIIVENSQIRIGKTMVLSLSFDHRVMDGAPAAEFLGELKHFIENPEDILSLQN